MTATQQKVEAWSGDDLVLPVWVTTETGAPEDLSTFTAFSYAVRDKPRGTLVFTPQKTLGLGVTVVGPPTNGYLEVTINGTDTAGYLVGGEKVTLWHELEGTKTGAKIRTLFAGPFVLHQSPAGAGTGTP